MTKAGIAFAVGLFACQKISGKGKLFYQLIKFPSGEKALTVFTDLSPLKF